MPMMMIVKIVDIIFARTPLWSTDWPCSNDQRVVGHYVYGSEPTRVSRAYPKLRRFSLYFGEICWYKPVQSLISQGLRIYSIRIPEIARLITNCWICSVPSKMS